MKEIRINGYSFIQKSDKELTEKDKEENYRLHVRMYPAFRKYYEKNRYYSTIKPQIIDMIKKGNKLIGSGKFLWKTLKIKNKKIKFFGFGILIDKEYQNKGLGTQLIKLKIEEAGKRKADLLYGSTKNPIAAKIMEKLGFVRLSTPVFYKEYLTNKKIRAKEDSYILEYKKGLIKEIESMKSFYIGKGPV